MVTFHRPGYLVWPVRAFSIWKEECVVRILRPEFPEAAAEASSDKTVERSAPGSCSIHSTVWKTEVFLLVRLPGFVVHQTLI